MKSETTDKKTNHRSALLSNVRISISKLIASCTLLTVSPVHLSCCFNLIFLEFVSLVTYGVGISVDYSEYWCQLPPHDRVSDGD